MGFAQFYSWLQRGVHGPVRLYGGMVTLRVYAKRSKLGQLTSKLRLRAELPNRIDLTAMTPHGELTSTGYCLANASSANAEYIVYQPSSGSFSVNLSNTPGSLSVEWFNPISGSASAGAAISGGLTRTFTPPFGGGAVLYLKGSASTVGPDLVLTKTHSGNFTQGQTGATYTLTVLNVGTAPTSGTVTVTDSLPAELTVTGLSGGGWSCTQTPLNCIRSDVLCRLEPAMHPSR